MIKEVETTIIDFLNNIGISNQQQTLSAEGRLQGLRLESGVISIDCGQVKWPGDLLYLAGLYSVSSPSARDKLCCSEKPGPELELPAMAWAYAAAVHLGIDPLIVFHEGGYQNGGKDIVRQFLGARPFGVPMLIWLGMCRQNEFPKMDCWIREIEDPTEESPHKQK